MSTVKAIRKLAKPDLLSIADLTPGEVESIFELSSLVKARPGEFARALAGKQLVLIFEKPSLRTRVTFEVGMGALGGRALFIDQTGSRLGARESLPDVARNLERWVDGIVLRTFAHQTITEMAAHAAVPVVNALSDREHPCQALADYFTLLEKFHDLKPLKLAFVGDGNNVAHSLLLTAARLGSRIAVATPPGFEPAADIVQAAVEMAAQTGASIQLTYDPEEALAGADAVYTDVWASMGQEHEAGERRNVFASFQVDDELMSHAAPHAVFMHCLPAHRGDEVTDAVMDSPRSVVFDQAENRLHIQKAILLLLLGNGGNGRRSRCAHA
ncbi:MAG TPA: ornithine carbamoyltransferase [Candidatus Xenobia bacterium]|nr:ornithine carbamoyltransferase [Candidatus Xenobia bacterium]